MGPLVILGILAKKPQGIFMIIASGIALLVFILSQAAILPGRIGPFRLDLLLMAILALLAVGNYMVKK